MKKAIWLLLLAMLLGCGSTAIVTRPAGRTDDDDEENVVANVQNDEAESELPAAAPAATGFDTFSPANSMSEAAVVRVQDWQKGAADPTIVIIEYSDFQ